MPSPSWRDIPLAACERARIHFCEEVAESMKYFDPEVGDSEHLGRYLTEKLTSLDDREFPDSVADFLRTISPAFHPKYLMNFELSCHRFDQIIGGSIPPSSSFSISNQIPARNLSDVFIHDLKFNEWIAEMCHAIALRCFETVSPGNHPMPQFDGTPDMPPPQAGVIDDGLFTQVTLVGPNLTEAWNRLPFTRELEDACHPPNWSPAQPGGMYVYHGTTAHLGDEAFISALTDRPFHGLVGKSNPNQITQGKDSIPIVWTSFSPFRAFLWAAFRADVVRDVPGPGTLSNLTSEWTFGEKPYRGVLLLQFASVQPSPPGCSHYIIPAGQEEHWATIASAGRVVPADEPTSKLWRRFASIHQQPSDSEWPDVVHGLELPFSHDSLRRFTRQCWRTVWFSGGIQELNSRHRKTIAIQYIFEPSLPPTASRQKSSNGQCFVTLVLDHSQQQELIRECSSAGY
ncbi:hypothetical protein V8E54_003650 [Elaphomyces granulatus]